MTLHKQNTELVLRSLRRNNYSADAIFRYLSERADYDGSVGVGQNNISEVTGYSLSTVKRCIKYLVNYGFVKIEKMDSRNIYCLNGELVGIDQTVSRYTCTLDFRDNRISL